MPDETLDICTWNARGLNASIPYLRSLFKSNDIICVTEHWLHQNRLSKLNEISEKMSVFGRSSKFSQGESFGFSKGQGGIALLWKDSFKSVFPLCQIDHDTICGIHIQTGNASTLNIFCVYLLSRGCEGDLQVNLDELSAILEGTKAGAHNIICGDFNADIGSKGVQDPGRTRNSGAEF